MPSCFQCGQETPVTNFFLVRQYVDSHGFYWYFCSLEHMKEWIANHGICANCGQLAHVDELMEGVVCWKCVAEADKAVEEVADA